MGNCCLEHQPPLCPVIPPIHGGHASDLRSVHHRTWCGMGDSTAETREQLGFGLLYWVSDLGDWQRLGGASPGWCLSPWSVTRDQGRATDSEITRGPGSNSPHRLFTLMPVSRTEDECSRNGHRPSSSQPVLDHPLLHLSDHLHRLQRPNSKPSLKLWWWIGPGCRKKNGIDRWELGHACTAVERDISPQPAR